MSNRILGQIVTGIAITGVLVAGIVCVEKIPTGYVGVQYSMSNGVEDELLTRGWKLVSPNKKIYLYSIKQEQMFMSADKKDGSKDDESINIMAKDGQLNVDFEMAYSFDPEDVVNMFEKFGGLSGEDIVNTKVRGRIRALIGEVVSQYTVMDVHLDKKSEVNAELTKHLAESLKQYGITVESATLARTKPSADVEAAIEKRTTVAQELEAEKLRQEKAIAEQETKKIEAETKKIENQKMNESLTPEMLQRMWIEKWDGKLPQVSGSDSIISMAPGTGAAN